MKKRIQSFFLAAVTAVFVGACGDDPDVSDASENKSSTKPAGAYSTISFQNEKIASQAYQQCAEMSYLFDRKIADFENELIFFANSLQFLVKVNSKPIPSPDIVYHENYLDAKKAPLTFSLFKPYGFSVDFEHICCRLPKDMKVADAEKRASDVASLFPQIKEIMANSHFGAEKDRNTNAAIERFKKEGAPVVLVFLAFRDGLYFCYPGKTYKDDYDPCARGWYKGRIGQDSPRAGWSEPYVNANQSDTVITYTVRLDDAVRKPQGVVAMDISLGSLMNGLKNILIEKAVPNTEITLMNENGVVIVTTNQELKKRAIENYKAHASENVQHGILYPDEKLFQQMKLYGNGYHAVVQDGKSVLYAFSKCQATSWYLLLKVNPK